MMKLNDLLKGAGQAAVAPLQAVGYAGHALDTALHGTTPQRERNARDMEQDAMMLQNMGGLNSDAGKQFAAQMVQKYRGQQFKPEQFKAEMTPGEQAATARTRTDALSEALKSRSKDYEEWGFSPPGQVDEAGKMQPLPAGSPELQQYSDRGAEMQAKIEELRKELETIGRGNYTGPIGFGGGQQEPVAMSDIEPNAPATRQTPQRAPTSARPAGGAAAPSSVVGTGILGSLGMMAQQGRAMGAIPNPATTANPVVPWLRPDTPPALSAKIQQYLSRGDLTEEEIRQADDVKPYLLR